jgi:hypothetical protein
LPTPIDHIRYDVLAREALRGVVRRVLADAARKGLPGDHHFFISFDTRAPGVRLSSRLREQYPEEMTIILQHQFWDLIVNDTGFEVGLSFNGVPEHLHVPFDAIRGFFDPSVQFGLQFEIAGEAESTPAAEPAVVSPATGTDQRPGAPQSARPQPAASPAATPTPEPQAPSASDPAPAGKAEPQEDETPSGGGAEVVRLDRFRKK